MNHYHVVIFGEPYRQVGALTNSFGAALDEKSIEEEKGRKADIRSCDKPCFGTRM